MGLIQPLLLPIHYAQSLQLPPKPPAQVRPQLLSVAAQAIDAFRAEGTCRIARYDCKNGAQNWQEDTQFTPD